MITDLADNPDLDPQTIRFLTQELGDQRLTASTRNNISNCLLIQRHVDPLLHRRLRAMIHDRTESATWREYAVQHLALCWPTASPKEEIVTELEALMADGDHGIPATAMLCLQRLEDHGYLRLDAGFAARIEAILRNPSAEASTLATALTLACERGERGCLEAVRRCTAHPLPSIRRVAMAALGAIGDAQDVPMLTAAAGDDDPTVSLAARSAVARLDLQLTGGPP